MDAVSPLAELIADCQREFETRTGVKLTFGDIARRAGGGLNRQNVHRMSSEPIKAMPAPDTLRALAKGLGVSEAVVTLRALQSAGYVIPNSDTDLTSHRRIG